MTHSVCAGKVVGMNQSATTPPEKRPKHIRVDWDAVSRDYRATHLTLRELADKHGCSHGRIAQKAKAEGWSRDLTEAIKQATDASLIKASVAELLTSQANQATQNLTSVVMVAAERNAQVILSHRSRLAALHQDVETAKRKLMEIGDSVADIREAATLVQAVGNLATATKTLIEQERKAFQLDEPGADESAKPQRRVMIEFVDVVAK